MTVSVTSTYDIFNGNDATTTFDYTFPVSGSGDLVVHTVNGSGVVSAALVLDTDYSVNTGISRITYPISGSPLATGSKLLVYRSSTINQTFDVTNQSAFYAVNHEDFYDKIVRIVQEAKFEALLAPRLEISDYDGAGIDMRFPKPVADKVPLIWNSTATGFDIGPTANDISNAQTYASNAATSATNAATSETNAATSATNAATSAASAAAAPNWAGVKYLTNADSPYTVVAGDLKQILSCDTSAGNIVVNLPTIASVSGSFTVALKKTNASNSVTINRAGTDTIDGGTSFTLTANNEGTFLTAEDSGSPDDWTSFTAGAAASFLALSDTPGAYSSSANKLVKVNNADNAIEFAVNTWPTADGNADDVLTTNGSGALAFGAPVYPPGHLEGLEVVINATDANHDIDIAVGSARSADDDTNMDLGSALVKQGDATWASGTNAGGLSSSLTALANDTEYYIHLIVVSGAVDVGFDTSATAANLVTDHSATDYRPIGRFNTDGSANIESITRLDEHGRGHTISTLTATGGQDGDIWYVYT